MVNILSSPLKSQENHALGVNCVPGLKDSPHPVLEEKPFCVYPNEAWNQTQQIQSDQPLISLPITTKPIFFRAREKNTDFLQGILYNVQHKIFKKLLSIRRNRKMRTIVKNKVINRKRTWDVSDIGVSRKDFKVVNIMMFKELEGGDGHNEWTDGESQQKDTT